MLVLSWFHLINELKEQLCFCSHESFCRQYEKGTVLWRQTPLCLLALTIGNRFVQLTHYHRAMFENLTNFNLWIRDIHGAWICYEVLVGWKLNFISRGEMYKIHMASFAVKYGISAETNFFSQLREWSSFFFSLSILVMMCSGLMTTYINNSL